MFVHAVQRREVEVAPYCPQCHRPIVRGEIGPYCARCGWYPNWRQDRSTKAMESMRS